MLKFEDIPQADRPRYVEAAKRYEAALHAMQTGIGMSLSFNRALTDPKHTRAGIDSAITSASSIGALLVRKGLVSAVELMEALADDTEADVRRYTQEIEAHYGAEGRVTLG